MLDLIPKLDGPLAPVLKMLYTIGAMVLVVVVLELVTAIRVKRKSTRNLLHIIYMLGLLLGIWIYAAKP